jgi:hypothetical protein
VFFDQVFQKPEMSPERLIVRIRYNEGHNFLLQKTPWVYSSKFSKTPRRRLAHRSIRELYRAMHALRGFRKVDIFEGNKLLCRDFIEKGLS